MECPININYMHKLSYISNYVFYYAYNYVSNYISKLTYYCVRPDKIEKAVSKCVKKC